MIIGGKLYIERLAQSLVSGGCLESYCSACNKVCCALVGVFGMLSKSLAILAFGCSAIVHADGGMAFFALGPLPSMIAYLRTPAVFTLGSFPAVLADGCCPAVLTSTPHSAMLANR